MRINAAEFSAKCLKLIDAVAAIHEPLVISPAVAVECAELPGEFHAAPAERLLVATARIGGYTLVTRDQKILDYGKAGHVSVLAA